MGILKHADEFRKNNELTDVEIIIGDKTYNFHKLILAIRSEYFKARFVGNYSGNKFKLEIPNCDDDIISINS